MSIDLTDCPICLEPVLQSEAHPHVHGGEAFHKSCIEKLPKDESGFCNCPMCNTKISNLNMPALLEAVHRGDEAAVRAELQNEVSEQLSGKALESAVRVQNLEIVRLILEQTRPAQELKNRLFKTALQEGNLSLIKSLKNHASATEVYLAALTASQEGKISLAIELLDGKDGAFDEPRSIALLKALDTENWEAAFLLLQGGSVSEESLAKLIPLAIVWGQQAIIDVAVAKQAIPTAQLIRILDSQAPNSTNTLNLLIEKNRENSAFIQHALRMAIHGNRDLLESLLENAPLEKLIFSIEMASQIGDIDLLEDLLNRENIPKRLLEKAVLISAYKEGRAQMDRLLSYRMSSIGEIREPNLLENRISVQCRAEASKICARLNNPDGLEALLENGPIGKDTWDRLFTHAAREHFQEVVNVLITWRSRIDRDPAAISSSTKKI